MKGRVYRNWNVSFEGLKNVGYEFQMIKGYQAAVIIVISFFGFLSDGLAQDKVYVIALDDTVHRSSAGPVYLEAHISQTGHHRLLYYRHNAIRPVEIFSGRIIQFPFRRLLNKRSQKVREKRADPIRLFHYGYSHERVRRVRELESKERNYEFPVGYMHSTNSGVVVGIESGTLVIEFNGKQNRLHVSKLPVHYPFLAGFSSMTLKDKAFGRFRILTVSRGENRRLDARNIGHELQNIEETPFGWKSRLKRYDFTTWLVQEVEESKNGVLTHWKAVPLSEESLAATNYYAIENGKLIMKFDFGSELIPLNNPERNFKFEYPMQQFESDLDLLRLSISSQNVRFTCEQVFPNRVLRNHR